MDENKQHKFLIEKIPLKCPHCGMSIRYSFYGTPVGYHCGSELGVYPSIEIETRTMACVKIAELNREIDLLTGIRIIGME
jgi:hypothetical protein